MAQIIRTMPPDPARFVLEYLQRKLGVQTVSSLARACVICGFHTVFCFCFSSALSGAHFAGCPTTVCRTPRLAEVGRAYS
jgi:hypothetical protein